MPERIYLDNSTATRPSRTAILSMMPFFEEAFGSTTQPHQMGQAIIPDIEKSYQAIYRLFGAKEADPFVFTSSGEEAVTQVIHSIYYESIRKTGKTHCITSIVDDAASILALSKLEEEGCALKFAKISPSGAVTVDTIIDEITPRTASISLSLASGLTGVIQPVAEIAKVCKQRGILLHVDVTYAIGKLFLDIDEIGANFITFDGEQLGAPKGTGGLFAKNADVIPLISGDGEKERFRGSSFNVPFFVALGQAAVEAEQNINLYCTEVARLRARFESQIQTGYPEAKLFFQDVERLPHIAVLAFPGVHQEALLYALNRKNVFSTIGGGRFQPLSQVLEAASVDGMLAQSAVSFALSSETTEREIDQAATIIIEAAKRLRRLSKALL